MQIDMVTFISDAIRDASIPVIDGNTDVNPSASVYFNGLDEDYLPQYIVIIRVSEDDKNNEIEASCFEIWNKLRDAKLNPLPIEPPEVGVPRGSTNELTYVEIIITGTQQWRTR